MERRASYEDTPPRAVPTTRNRATKALAEGSGDHGWKPEA